MLKGKIKLPEKVQLTLPHKLNCLPPVFFGKEDEEENAGVVIGFESGEELVIFHPNQRGLQDEIDVCDEKFCFIPKARVAQKQLNNLEAIAIDEKRSDLEFELSQKDINLEKLQRMASSGIPDGGSLRATIWKLLLGYLPASRDLWEKELSENRLKYRQLKQDLLLNPSECSRRHDNDLEINKPLSEIYSGEPLDRQEVSNEDHPLSLGKTSVWHQYFEFSEISEQIDRDLQRTHPDIEFFAENSSIGRKNKESMRDILILFAKLNPEIRYVQGMNEVLAPLYFVFSADSDVTNAENAEVDAFSCFVRLMSDSLDHFCEQLDNSSVGIRSTLSRLSELLKNNDEELWTHLELLNKVDPQFYAFRWITLLLTQEFSLETILRIWDSLLSNPFGIQDMLLRICCAMLMCVRTELLSGDFVDNLKLLQHYPPQIHVEHILQVALGINPDTSSFQSSL